MAWETVTHWRHLAARFRPPKIRENTTTIEGMASELVFYLPVKLTKGPTCLSPSLDIIFLAFFSPLLCLLFPAVISSPAATAEPSPPAAVSLIKIHLKKIQQWISELKRVWAFSTNRRHLFFNRLETEFKIYLIGNIDVTKGIYYHKFTPSYCPGENKKSLHHHSKSGKFINVE